MKVGELLKHLSVLDPNLEVAFTWNGCRESGSWLGITSVEQTSLAEQIIMDPDSGLSKKILKRKFALLHSNREDANIFK